MSLSPATDTSTLKSTFGHYPSGVAAISAEVDGVALVLVSSSFTVGVSLEPPLVMFAVQHSSQTWPLLKKATRLGVSVLSSKQDALCRQLSSGDRSARFDGVVLVPTDSDAVLFEGASAWMHCSVFAEHRAGDHDIVVLRVHDHDSDFDSDPLVFHGSAFRSFHDHAAG
ncbi:flavin reductase family protein [Nocardia aobensis]|uniref:Flavin reductase family protein n=1 Tax=Nocardia aobensis TaxID=257277 RepID=A0ABW6PFS9_9NOCA